MTGSTDIRPTKPQSNEASWRKISTSLRETLAGEAVVQVLRFSGLIILARALDPAKFGVFKILVVIGTVAIMLNEAGLPDALIQREQVERSHEATAWWINLAVSVATCSFLYAGAGKIAWLMGMPELAFASRLICIPILLEGITATAGAQLRRDMRFDLLALADVFSEVAFLGVALAFLYRGSTQWCLAAALGARYGVHAIACQVWSGYVPRSLPHRREARELAPFSAGVLGGRLITLASSNADYILVGRLLGSSALGLYSIAWDLLRLIPDRVYRVVGRVAFPAFCQLREPEAIGSAYANIVDSIARLVLPTSVGLAIVAPQLLITVYGARWAMAAEPLRLLAAGLALAGTRVAIGSVYYAKGRPDIDIYLHGARLVLIAIAVLAAASAGLPAVCAAVSFTEALVTIAGQWLAGALAGISFLRLCKAYSAGLRTALLCGLIAEAGILAGRAAELSQPAVLGIAIVLTATVFIILESSNLLKSFQRGFAPATQQVAQVSQ